MSRCVYISQEILVSVLKCRDTVLALCDPCDVMNITTDVCKICACAYLSQVCFFYVSNYSLITSIFSMTVDKVLTIPCVIYIP